MRTPCSVDNQLSTAIVNNINFFISASQRNARIAKKEKNVAKLLTILVFQMWVYPEKLNSIVFK